MEWTRNIGLRSRVPSSNMLAFSKGNLRVVTGALALKILYDSSGEAQGVLVLDVNRSVEVKVWARQQVVISAGVLGYPPPFNNVY